MIEIIKDNWAVLSAVIGGWGWALIRGERLRVLESDIKILKQAKVVSCEACKENRTTCRAHIEAEFLHGKDDFEEIKAQIALADAKSEERHNTLIKHLLNGSNNYHI